MQIKESAENYLKSILITQKEKGYGRCKEIDKRGGFSKPFVGFKKKNWREDEYMAFDQNGNITLRKKGREMAKKIYDRHNVIAGFLMQLGTPEEIAYQDSCKMEHDLSEVSFQLMKEQYLKHLNKA